MSRTVKSAWAFAMCAACGPELDRGTFEAASWPQMNERPSPNLGAPETSSFSLGLPVDMTSVSIVQGDESMISGIDGALGLRFDEERNDLAAVTTRIGETMGKRRGVLVLFTTFDDVGAAGPAYYVPFYVSTTGLGRAPIDQRELFGVSNFLGVANMKRVGSHTNGKLLPRLLHEIAHRDLAYLEAEISGSTVAVPLLGRQNAHWNAALHTEGSVLGGHDFLEIGPGEFSVQKINDGYSPLDLYGLGLLPADRVPPFFYIRNMRNLRGFAIPDEAELPPRTHVLGERVTVTIDDVIRASGPRGTDDVDRQLDLAVVLLTAPGESITSTRALAAQRDISAAMDELYGEYPSKTGGATVCPYKKGCDGVRDTIAPEECGCTATRSRGPSGWWLGAIVLFRYRRRGRSSGCSLRPDERPRPAKRPLDR